MKLFKKLAAAVLAAALALTMVGCGGGNSYAMQDELLKITIDNLTDVNETVTHTKKADEMAAALLAAADTAAAQEANNGKDAKELLLDPAVIKAAKIDLEKNALHVQPDRCRQSDQEQRRDGRIPEDAVDGECRGPLPVCGPRHVQSR